ncbi:MAG: leucine-rich repeat protein, partial [Clostridia bacterium]|nr:leucine-rich repeat protein [Clostridia bacterium]
VPEGVNSIGVNAFAGLGMEEIVLPNSLRDINGYAFSHSRMSELSIPASVDSVGNNILAWSDQIQIIRFYGDKPEYLDDHAFNDIASEYQIIYRKSANGWDDVEGAESFIYYGDVSADGVLDENDVNLLNQYFAGWPAIIDHEALDFNDDDMVTRADAMYLARYLAGWSGYGRKH